MGFLLTTVLEFKIHNKKGSSHQQTGLKFNEKSYEILPLEHRFLWSWNLDTSKSKSEITGEFWNEVLEKAGEEYLDQLCKKLRSIILSQGEEEYPTT